MISKQALLKSFDNELSYQKFKNLFIKEDLVKYIKPNLLRDLNDLDKSDVLSIINNKINQYNIEFNNLNNKHYCLFNNNFYNNSFISLFNRLSFNNNNIFHFINTFSINNNQSIITSIVVPLEDDKNDTYDNENEDVTNENIEKILSSFPTLNFIKSSNIIHIPNKTKTIIDKYISIKDLKMIDKDVETAKECCYMFLSIFAKTYYLFDDKDSWIYFSKYNMAKRIFGSVSTTARKKLNILTKILEKGSKLKGGIIEINKDVRFEDAKRLANEYRLTECYRNKGFIKYQLKTKKCIETSQKNYYNHLYYIMDNSIVKNLFRAYSSITLPTDEQIINRAKELVKSSYMKHNKVLKFRNKKAKELDDNKKYIYVEDSIEIFKYLTSDGLLLPSVGEEKAGGRVSDSFTLMPSWIRSLVKFDGRLIEEYDYSCLHPNIAMSLYGGSKKYLTHQQVSDESGIDKTTVKIEHLSFFNRNVADMKKRSLYDYYSNTEKQMMNNIIQEKYQFGYKETSKKMFTLEVQIMTDVIKQLNEKHIYVMYIYDAIACNKKHSETIMKIMNDTILKYGVYTICHK